MILEMAGTVVTSHQQSNWVYLQDELARLRLLLLRYSLWQQARLEKPDRLEQDFYVSDARAQSMRADMDVLDARSRQAWTENDLPLKRLAAAFGLTPFEVRALLLAASVELDASFETLLAQCQAESAARLPTVALALRLFCETAEEWVQARLAFSAPRPLARWNMLHLDARAPSLLSSAFHLDPRIANHLLGADQPPAELTGRVQVAGAPAPDSLIRDDMAARLSDAIHGFLAGPAQADSLVVNLAGASGSGRRTLAATACARLGLMVMAACASDLAGDNSLLLFLRETILQRAVAFLDCTGLPEEMQVPVSQACGDGARLTFVATTARAAWLENQPGRMVLPIEVPPLQPEERRRLWALQVDGGREEDLESLALQFPFTPGDIQRAAAAARARTLLRSPGDPRLSLADAWQAAREHPQHRLGELARRIEPHNTWDDIVLPVPVRQQLLELEQQVSQQTRVYETWGFGQKLSRGRGVNALFSGTSGTGKTMAAEILAGALNLEMYRIDLSSVVSKYIGETEKNLARVFDEAERGSVILFFDEADALFGKRSEVKDAHDRYANIEINYLLQRMEDYRGVAILATNMRQALDEAFLRRLRFLVEFPFPDAEQRAGIWRKSFPAQTPRQEIDIDFLARQFKIAGGNIRNIALNAAFLAAAENAPVGMLHVIRATRREFDKIGKACLESDFGPYYAWIR